MLIHWVGFIFVYQKSLKQTFKNSFWVQNHLLNLCSGAMNTQRLLCSQIAGVKCSYWSFLVYVQMLIFGFVFLRYVLKEKKIKFWDGKPNWILNIASPSFQQHTLLEIQC